MQPLITQKRLFLVIALICLGLVANCSRTTPAPPNILSAQTSSQDAYRVLETETFRDTEVSAREIVFKVADCETGDRKAFLSAVESFVRETFRDVDDKVQVSKIGNGCWYLATSSRLTVDRLFNQLQSKISLNLTGDSSPPQTPQVTDVEPNFIIRLQPSPDDQPVKGLPSDDYFQKGELWGLSNQQSPGIDIDALRAWEVSKGSDKIVVGVIDTGIYYDHPDLKRNVWTALKEFKITVGVKEFSCQAGTYGLNVVGTTKEERCDPLDGTDGSGHGTHVSGIIGAVGDNHVGVVGVNWTTKILALKFMRSGAGKASWATEAIDAAIELRKKADVNIRVLNISWGYRKGFFTDSESNMLRDSIETASENKILVVASAGEDGGSNNDIVEHYPSGYRLLNLISVTAIDRNGFPADRVNFGLTTVDLWAPGSGIYSTYPINLGDTYYRSSGTSMAAPFVSGAAALILSVEPKCSELSASELKEAILRGVTATRTAIPTSTGGMLNVYKSIELCNR